MLEVYFWGCGVFIFFRMILGLFDAIANLLKKENFYEVNVNKVLSPSFKKSRLKMAKGFNIAQYVWLFSSWVGVATLILGLLSSLFMGVKGWLFPEPAQLKTFELEMRTKPDLTREYIWANGYIKEMLHYKESPNVSTVYSQLTDLQNWYNDFDPQVAMQTLYECGGCEKTFIEQVQRHLDQDTDPYELV